MVTTALIVKVMVVVIRMNVGAWIESEIVGGHCRKVDGKIW